MKYWSEKKSKFQEFTKSSPYRGPFFRAITAETRPILVHTKRHRLNPNPTAAAQRFGFSQSQESGD
jgi:hypothetical protein